jgi:hypothetical protein
MALEMYISVSTAKTYVARLYEKLGAANRAQALLAAMHHGLIQYQRDASPDVPPLEPHRRAQVQRRASVAGSLALVGPDPAEATRR